MPECASLLELIHVAKTYEGFGMEAPAPVLTDVSLKAGAGESLAVVGPSGSGKSTLLNLIGGLDRPSSGQILMGGKDLSGLEETELSRIRNREIGFVFQRHHLLGQLSVLENVLVPTLVRKDIEDRERLEDRAQKLLSRVGLSERLAFRPGRLSGGERQRVAVVRALINRPRLLLADEPTGSLDRAASEQLGDLLLELNREEGVTLLVVTHATDLAGRMDRILELNDGRLFPSKDRA